MGRFGADLPLISPVQVSTQFLGYVLLSHWLKYRPNLSTSIGRRSPYLRLQSIDPIFESVIRALAFKFSEALVYLNHLACYHSIEEAYHSEGGHYNEFRSVQHRWRPPAPKRGRTKATNARKGTCQGGTRSSIHPRGFRPTCARRMACQGILVPVLASFGIVGGVGVASSPCQSLQVLGLSLGLPQPVVGVTPIKGLWYDRFP